MSGRDSSAIPTDDTLLAAYDAGVRVWGGYFDGPDISHGWTAADFLRIKAMGMTAVAYCSGFSDPAAMRQQQLAWGVDYLFLDVESGIRSDGPWVQSWLYDAQCGLYGNASVFTGRTFPYAQLAAYPGTDPESTWPVNTYPPTPTVPHGWQWRGSHDEFGINCDSAYWDDSFATQHPGYTFKESDPVFAVRPDGSAVDYFFIDANKNLGIGNISSSGKQTQTTPSPYAGHVITAIQAAAWTTGCLVAQVVGDDGITYLARWTSGAWQELLAA